MPDSNSSYETEGQYDYSDYYNLSQFHDYGICEKKHVRAFARIFLPILYAFVSVLGFIGNGLLAGILIKYIKLKRMTDIYLLNLAVSDLLFVATLPFWAVYAHSEWVFGSILCKVITLIYTINLYSSIFFIICISMDSYLNIVWTFSTKNLKTSRKSFAICSMVWTISILASIPDLKFTELQEFNGQKICILDFGDVDMSPWRIFMKFQLNIVGFFIPFLTMVFFYSRISCVMARTRPTQKSRNPLKLAVILVAVFFLLWFPYNLVVFLHSLQDLHLISDCNTSRHLDFAVQVTESLAFVHACLNPILYAFVNQKFLNCLNKILKRICTKGRQYSLECTNSTPPTTQCNFIELTVVEKL
ncbi:atypical chemokine receptor 2 [Lepisosteus oculatus]|uniref:atypical chemokine receptor 2 n=1 Tax=Lepisosteus oculatus TaxID=7918 RepID=UPI00371EE681